MRILISNPDNIGDVVLRQPMFAALTAAGHELSLVVRSFVEPIADLVAPEAQVISFASNPYSPDFDPDCEDISRALAATRRFAPDVFCIAPYQRTVFDELLADSLEHCSTVGMAGMLYAGDVRAGLNHASKLRLDREVPVPIDQHELEKNERLCAELLRETVRLPDPRLEAHSRHLDDARSILARLGLNPGQYWVASVGQNQYTAVKNWGLESWAKVLAHAVKRHGQHFVLIGTPDEHDASEQVRSLMGAAGDAVANLCDSPPALPVTVGLMQLSAGYIGRDTGPMHIAAALGKPVIAVFGGGNWPRFTPRPKAGFVASVVMPCAGCDWVCHLAEPYCVRRVPADSIIEAFDAIQAGNVTGLQIQQLRIDQMLSARSLRESADSCRDLMRRAARAERQLAARAETGDELARTQAERASVKAERDYLESQLLVERNKVDLLKADMAKAQNQADVERQSLMDVLNDLLTQQSELRQEVEDFRGRLHQSEQSLEETRQSLRDTQKSLEEHRQSISFRFLATFGRPLVAVHRLVRALFSRS